MSTTPVESGRTARLRAESAARVGRTRTLIVWAARTVAASAS